MTAKRFAMVLSGGGAKGIYQVGVFNALAEYDLEIAALSGSSVGAINAFAYAALPNEQINSLWDEFGYADFFTTTGGSPDALFNQTGLERVLAPLVREHSLLGKAPVYATLCNDRGYAQYPKLNDKIAPDVLRILLASSAIPLVYPKVSIGFDRYRDGGVADNLPVLPLFLDGFTNLIVVGVDESLKIDRYRYPTDNIIEITPSQDLGGHLDGTVNFSASYKAFAKRLGYYDAKRAINAYLGISNAGHSEAEDAAALRLDTQIDASLRKIESTFDKLGKYL